MGNTEEIYLGHYDDKIVFKIFKRIPVPIAREIQKLSLIMVEDYDGDISDLEEGKVNPRQIKNIKLDILYEIYDILLTKAVLNPKICKEDIDNIDHEFQPYFQDLSDLLYEKFADHKASIKKKSLK